MNSSDALVKNNFAPWLPLLHTVLWICIDNTDSPCCVCKGAEALDECGLRYLLAMRLHTCLLTSLPPLYRMQLLHQGKNNSACFIMNQGLFIIWFYYLFYFKWFWWFWIDNDILIEIENWLIIWVSMQSIFMEQFYATTF